MLATILQVIFISCTGMLTVMTSSLHTIKLKLNACSIPLSELVEWASPYIFPVHCLSFHCSLWYTEVCGNMPTRWRQMHAPCWSLDLQWSKWQNCSRVSLVLLVYWFLPFRDLLNLWINSKIWAPGHKPQEACTCMWSLLCGTDLGWRKQLWLWWH